MAKFFKTEMSIAILSPLAIFFVQYLFKKIFSNTVNQSTLFGFHALVLSGLMIHLGKGMIEWHFHIFVTIGVLSLFANVWTIIVAALTVSVHHIAFYFFQPSSLFNYDASIWIVVIHALFVIFESIACVYLAIKFKNILNLQSNINNNLLPVVESVESSSELSSNSCSKLMMIVNSNTASVTQMSASSE